MYSTLLTGFNLLNGLLKVNLMYAIFLYRLMQECLTKLINRLGEESSKAQGLNRVITNTERFRISEDQILYLLKDPEAQGYVSSMD